MKRAVCVLVTATLGCSSPTTPTTIGPAPSITCPPAPASATSANGAPIAVSYGVANSVGGVAPVNIVCTPMSGSQFPVGSTTVTCTATDAMQRNSTCSFSVTVIGPSLGVTNFLAFGDSITAGEVPDNTDTSTGRVGIRVVQPALSYPTQLQTMLQQRYPAQAASITVFGDGLSLETTDRGAARLDGELLIHHPQVLLLLEGVNDLAGDLPSEIPPAISNLQAMIRDAKGRGAKVLIGTLPPEIPGLKRSEAADLVVPFNNQLIPMALSEGALVVDLYSGFLADTGDWISQLDGLHPTPAGYQEMAQLFFRSITANFEVPPVLAVTQRPGRGTPLPTSRTISGPH